MNVNTTARLTAITGLLLAAAPVKARGALDGLVTALPLGAGAPGADGVEIAAWIWPSEICFTGVAATAGAVTVTVTVRVGQTDDAGTKIAGIGVVAENLLGTGRVVGTSLGAGMVVGTSLGAGLDSGITFGVLKIRTWVGTEGMVVGTVTGITAGVLEIATSVGTEEMVVWIVTGITFGVLEITT